MAFANLQFVFTNIQCAYIINSWITSKQFKGKKCIKHIIHNIYLYIHGNANFALQK